MLSELPKPAAPQDIDVLLLGIGYDETMSEKYWGVLVWQEQYYVFWKRIDQEWIHQPVTRQIAQKRWGDKKSYYFPLSRDISSDIFTTVKETFMVSVLTGELYQTASRG